jgi:hypothetical protein
MKAACGSTTFGGPFHLHTDFPILGAAMHGLPKTLGGHVNNSTPVIPFPLLSSLHTPRIHVDTVLLIRGTAWIMSSLQLCSTVCSD